MIKIITEAALFTTLYLLLSILLDATILNKIMWKRKVAVNEYLYMGIVAFIVYILLSALFFNR